MTEKNNELAGKLVNIQQCLNAPKSQFNAFGKYKFRNCEDILEAVKPLLNGSILTISDELINVGDRYYVQATAKLELGEEYFFATAFARETESKKGMDEAQITGSASSYARKYALNGLFLIDDSKDPDTRDNSNIPNSQPTNNFKGPQKITKENVLDLSKLIEDTETNIDKFLEYFKIDRLDHMNTDQLVDALKILNKKIDGGK